MIDAHVHLWRLGVNDCTWPTSAEAAIHRDVEAAELIATLDAAGIDTAVLVQSQESALDTEWLLAAADIEPRIRAVVGWAPLHDAAAVQARASHPLLAGLRPMVQHRAADCYDDPLLDPALRLMTEAGLVFEALVRPQHLPALARLALRHPDLAIVIDHGAKPDIAGGAIEPWGEALAPLAGLGNVACKLSGLLSEKAPEQPDEAVLPYGEAILTLFGAERTIWGSDWPVLNMASGYDDWLALARSIVPVADRAAVFGGNAARLYAGGGR